MTWRILESRLAEKVEQAVRNVTRPAPSEPLEIVAMAVDEVAKHVQPAGRGRFGFPFNAVTITFLAPTAGDRARFEAICDGPPDIEDRIRRRLASAGHEDADIDVSIRFASESDPAWARPECHVSLARVSSEDRLRRDPLVRLDVQVVRGVAEQPAYSFSALPIAIGRGAEVRDSQQQLIRFNHVAFSEGGDEAATTVSRRHARIEMDPRTQRPRVLDDNSAHGTSVIRAGRGIAVPRGSRGLGLQTGDEIVLGQARIKVEISEPGR